MEEKEIIKIVNDYLIKNEFCLNFIDEDKEKKQYLAIKGLSELYIKEKETNRILNDIIIGFAKEYGKGGN